MDNELVDLFQKALQALNPYDSVLKVFEDGAIRINDAAIPLVEYQEIYLLAMGKASVEMAKAVQSASGVRHSNILVVCPRGSEIPEALNGRVIEAEHPVPGSGSERAGREVLAFVERIPAGSLLICCISGGTSSLLALPTEGISLEELNRTHEMLLGSGADIHEMNAVRKHLSSIKGGQLLRHLNREVTLINLIISDVPGDDPAVIGSGPTVADSSTFVDASKVLSNYGLWDKVPESVQSHIKRGMSGNAPETVKELKMEYFTRVVASAKMLADRVGELAVDPECRIQNSEFRIQNSEGSTAPRLRRLNVEVADAPFTEDVQKVASYIAGRAKEVAKAKADHSTLLVYYGESKVKVTGSGKGGRNQELALRGAMKIAGLPNISWLSVGTDGIDGPTDAAGALVDGRTFKQAQGQGLDPKTYLENNDSYHFHEQMGTLVKTGPTGNNLMDVTLVLVE